MVVKEFSKFTHSDERLGGHNYQNYQLARDFLRVISALWREQPTTPSPAPTTSLTGGAATEAGEFLETCRAVVKNALADHQKSYHFVRAVIAPYNQGTVLLATGKACEMKIDPSTHYLDR